MTLSEIALFLSMRCGVAATRSSVLRTYNRLRLPLVNGRDAEGNFWYLDVREFAEDL